MPDNEPNVTPCYLSYTTFKNTIQSLALNGSIPRQIDHSVLLTMGGSSRKMFLAALRFFELIEGGRAPTQRLGNLANAPESEWKAYMETLLQEKYSRLLDELADASPKMLRDRFIETFNGIGASLVDSAIRFLVAAARDAGLPVSPRLTQRKVRAPNAPRKRASKIAKQNVMRDEPKESDHINREQSFRMALMDKFPSYDPAWSPEQHNAWFEAFKKLMDMSGENEPAVSSGAEPDKLQADY